jgi:hypothetical protein
MLRGIVGACLPAAGRGVGTRPTDGRVFTGRRGVVGRAAGRVGLRSDTGVLGGVRFTAAFAFAFVLALGFSALLPGAVRFALAVFFDALPRPALPPALPLAIPCHPRNTPDLPAILHKAPAPASTRASAWSDV